MFKRASEILGYDLLKVCTEGPKEKLDSTEVRRVRRASFEATARQLSRTRRALRSLAWRELRTRCAGAAARQRVGEPQRARSVRGVLAARRCWARAARPLSADCAPLSVLPLTRCAARQVSQPAIYVASLAAVEKLKARAPAHPPAPDTPPARTLALAPCSCDRAPRETQPLQAQQLHAPGAPPRLTPPRAPASPGAARR
jgi:hypothetical protein